MRFCRLYLKAFGQFRDRVIELPHAAGHDFHLLFGPNEAGKSTLLRAVTAFLFGVPERTDDGFLHGYAALRVGATLQGANGKRLSAMRRKARKASLFALDEDGGAENTERPLSEAVQVELTGGLDELTYRSLFGLDLEGLVSGSQELLRGEGEVGRSLFQAAAGLAGLRAVGAALETAAAASFRARGSTGHLNRALQDYEEQRRLVRDATVRTSAWENAERDWRQATQDCDRQRATLRERRAARQRLERIRGNLPLLAEHALRRAEASELAAVPLLPAGAAQQRVTAQEQLRKAAEAGRAAAARQAQFQGEFAQVLVQGELIAMATAIEQAFHALPTYRAARDALPGLARRGAELDHAVAEALGEIGAGSAPAQAASVVPPATLKARVLALIEEHARLADQREQLEALARARQQSQQRQQALVAAQSTPPAVDALEAAVMHAAGLEDLEARARELERDLRTEDASLQRESTALWPGTLAELVSLTVPLPASAEAFESEFLALTQEQRVNTDRTEQLARDLLDRQRELVALAAAGEMVTQAEVTQARAERDARWSDLRACLGNGAASPATPAAEALSPALPARFEAAMREADRLADLLHADTQRATHLSATRQRIADMQAEVARTEAVRQLLTDQAAALAQRWNKHVAALRSPGLTPAALREWLARHQRFVERFDRQQGRRVEAEQLAERMSQARNQLEDALRTCGLPPAQTTVPAAGLLERARQAVKEVHSARSRRNALQEQLAERAAELEDLKLQQQRLDLRLAEWQQQWAGAASSLHLVPQALPVEARVRLDQFDRLATAITARQACAEEAHGYEVVVTDFEALVERIRREAGRLGHPEPADAAAERLYAALGEARKAAMRRQRLADDIARETRARQDAEFDAQEAARVLDALVHQAGCRSPEELPAIEAQAQRRAAARERLRELEQQLVEHNARPVEALVQEAGASTLESVEMDIAALEEDIGARDRALEAAQEVLYGARQRFEAIDGGTRAAEAAQAMHAMAARVAAEARQWARVRLAGAVLERVVQQYREQHQGPLLRRAGELFARITQGSFAALTVDYVDDRQVLLGVRPGGARVPVLGMSQGTRDQLFLSLRLAAIEQHVASRGAFPVIVDDLLVQFDDERAGAALSVLAELGARTQVLFFTHHRHLAELAERAGLAGSVRVQAL